MASSTDGPAKRQVSLVGLILLVTAFAIAFGATRWIASYGLTVGVLLLFAAVGNCLRRPPWIMSGLAGAGIVSATLLFSYWGFGTVSAIDLRYGWEASQGFSEFDEWLAHCYSVDGKYPSSKAELIARTDIPETTTLQLEYSSQLFAYELLDEGGGPGYQVTFLGRDGKPGGEGVKADCTQETLAKVGDTRVPLRQFLFDEYRAAGGPRILFVPIFGVIVAFSFVLAASDASAKEANQRFKVSWASVIGVSILFVVLIGVGCFMASLHIAIGQSNH